MSADVCCSSGTDASDASQNANTLATSLGTSRVNATDVGQIAASAQLADTGESNYNHCRISLLVVYLLSSPAL